MYSKTLIYYNYWFLLSTSTYTFFLSFVLSPTLLFLIFLSVLSVPFLLFLFLISALLLCLCLFLSSSFFHDWGINESHLGVRASHLEKRVQWVAPVFQSDALILPAKNGKHMLRKCKLEVLGRDTDPHCDRKGPLDRKMPNVVDYAHPSPSDFLATMCTLKSWQQPWLVREA